MTRTTSFAVPEGSIGWWRDRLRAASVVTGEIEERFEEAALPFLDPDGMRLELVAAPGPTPAAEHWPASGIALDRAIRGFHGVTLLERAPEPTAAVLEGLLGYALSGTEGARHRFSVGGTDAGRHVDLLIDASAGPGNGAAGTVHHIAFRAADDGQQEAIRERLVSAGTGVSPVMDRQYFRSIYFREPGGVLFEIATDPPGFTHDESVDELGTGLKLPPWLESDRDRIEATLPALRPAARPPEARS
jgi:glyoxalase family protein